MMVALFSPSPMMWAGQPALVNIYALAFIGTNIAFPPLPTPAPCGLLIFTISHEKTLKKRALTIILSSCVTFLDNIKPL